LVASMVLFVVSIVAVLFGNFDSYVYMAVITASVGVLFIRFVIFYPQDTSDDLAIRGIYRIEYFIMTGILGIIGILLFFADDWISFDAYDMTHPFWHVLIGCTIGLAIRGVRYRDQYDALRQRKSFQGRQIGHRSSLIDSGAIRTLLGAGRTHDDSGSDDGLLI